MTDLLLCNKLPQKFGAYHISHVFAPDSVGWPGRQGSAGVAHLCSVTSARLAHVAAV